MRVLRIEDRHLLSRNQRIALRFCVRNGIKFCLFLVPFMVLVWAIGLPTFESAVLTLLILIYVEGK